MMVEQDVSYPSMESVLALLERISNTGRWGADDELGTLNMIDDGKRIRAAKLVRDGISITIGKEVDPNDDDSRGSVIHRMLYAGDSLKVSTGIPDPEPIALGTLDVVEITPHEGAITHLDAFAHINYQGRLYNGRWTKDAVSVRGLRFGSTFAFRGGIVTRGVLLDIPATRELDRLPPGAAVRSEDLTAAESATSSRIEPGDAVFVYTGRQTSGQSSFEGPKTQIGLMPECLDWLHDRDVGLYVGDSFDRFDAPYEGLPFYFHVGCLVSMGLPMLDNPNLDPLVAHCRGTQRSDFMFICSPLAIRGTTGAPVNPVCLF